MQKNVWSIKHTHAYVVGVSPDKKFWNKIHDILSEVTETSLRPKARRCLLNIWEPTDLNTAEILWVTLGLTIAKRNIVQKWGAAQVPTVKAWKKDLDWCMYREKTT